MDLEEIYREIIRECKNKANIKAKNLNNLQDKLEQIKIIFNIVQYKIYNCKYENENEKKILELISKLCTEYINKQNNSLNR